MPRIVLTRLTCHETEDNTGPDEAWLRVWSDNSYQSLRRSMNNGDDWNLNVVLDFNHRVKIKLYDRDQPGFPWYDDHDHLGTVIINPSQASAPGNGTFGLDGADYDIEWIPMDRSLERALEDHGNRSREATRKSRSRSSRSQDGFVVAPETMDQLIDAAEELEELGSERGVFGSKHTYCCQMGNDGNISETQQFRSYSWQAPLFCMRMARGKGYNSGSVSRGECP